jgi:hypothetical protein
MKKTFTLLGLLFSLNLFSQTTYYVKTSGDDAGSGASWTNAFQTLQKALSTAGSGDQIWVGQGTYYPDEGDGLTDNDRNLSFSLKNGVAIYGGFSGSETEVNQRNWKINLTILSGDIDQVDGKVNNSYRVLRNYGVNNTAILDGFTITEGNANNSGSGGGMYNNNSSPSLFNCSL